MSCPKLPLKLTELTPMDRWRDEGEEEVTREGQIGREGRDGRQGGERGQEGRREGG